MMKGAEHQKSFAIPDYWQVPTMVRPANSTAKSNWNRWPKVAHALFVIAVFPSYATGTQYRTPLAVETNLLVYDGKVAFIGYPSGLTILDVRTGQPILRQQRGDEFRGVESLQKCSTGILIVGYRNTSLVDATSFQPI